MSLTSLVCAGTLSLASPAFAEDAKSALEAAARALGAGSLQSVEYTGSGLNFALGQSPRPDAPWPKFNLVSYTRLVDFAAPASREEMVRTQGENPPRGGGGQPLLGEQRQVLLVSGDRAWNVAGDQAVPAPAAATERRLQIWLTPHGFVKAALAAPSPTLKTETREGRKVSVVSFVSSSKHKLEAVIDGDNLVRQVATWLDNPVLGDMIVETTFSEYKDYGGTRFPTRIVQKHGGFPTLDLTVSEVKPNAGTPPPVPDAASEAAPSPVKVDVQKIAEGVWYLAGGSHHSVAVLFNDHVVVIEGPQGDERSLAVIAEVKRLSRGKPIRYLINTHHHFDHSGGIRAYAAEGATILTHETNKRYYEKAFAAPRTLSPDVLALSRKKARIETLGDKRILTDGIRTLEIYLVKGNTHNEGLLMAYLPREKVLIEADAFTPGAPNARPPATPNPFSLNLYVNVMRLGLDVNQIAPLHGRLVTFTDLKKAIGKPITE